MPKATAIFICDVRVKPALIAQKGTAWKLGTYPIPSGTRPDGSQLYSDGKWRANYFPATMSSFLYGEIEGTQGLTAMPVRFHRLQEIDLMPYVVSKTRRVDGKSLPNFPEVESFSIRRLEILLADRITDRVALAQIALVCDVVAKTEKQLKDVIRSFASAYGRGKHRGVRGRYLHEVIEREAPELNIEFPTAQTLRDDTEANTYTAILLQKTPEEVEELSKSYPEELKAYEPVLPLLVEYSTNLSPGRIAEDIDRFDQEQENRFITFNRAGYGYFARYYATFIAIQEEQNRRFKNFIVSFEAEYLDALLLGRLQDQMLRRSELRLVEAMAGAAHSNNLGKTSDQVLALYREIEVDSVRYWMDDASANTGKTMEVLHEYKEAIEFYKRYGVMKEHAATIMNIATRDQQEAVLESQDRIALILAIVGALVIPLPLLNDGFDFVGKVTSEEGLGHLLGVFLAWFALSGLVLGVAIVLVNWLLSMRRGKMSRIFSILRPRLKNNRF